MLIQAAQRKRNKNSFLSLSLFNLIFFKLFSFLAQQTNTHVTSNVLATFILFTFIYIHSFKLYHQELGARFGTTNSLVVVICFCFCLFV